MYVILDINHHCTYSHRGEGDYPDWEEHYDFSVRPSGKIVTKKSYNSEPLPDGLNKGDTVFAIIANWSSGDSFGHDSGGRYDTVALFKSKELADKALEILAAKPNPQKGKSYLNNYDGITVSFSLDNGNVVNYYRDWLSYFESLDSLEIYPILLK